MKTEQADKPDAFAKNADAFHEHLDACAHCASHPFDLCKAGEALLRSAVDAAPFAYAEVAR